MMIVYPVITYLIFVIILTNMFTLVINLISVGAVVPVIATR